MVFSGGNTTKACSPLGMGTDLGKVGDISLCAISFHLFNTFIKPFCNTPCLLGTSNNVSIILHFLHFLFHPSGIHSLYLKLHLFPIPKPKGSDASTSFIVVTGA